MNARDPLIRKIRLGLEAEADGLPDRTKSGLAAARGAALAGRPRKGGMGLRRVFAPGAPWLRAAALGGMAAAVFLVMTYRQSGREISTAAPVAQIDLLVSDQSLDFYDNLEFSAWLAENDRAG